MLEGRARFAADLILAWTPFFVIFIALPIAIYSPNQIEFEYKLTPVVTLAAIGAAMLLPLSAALYWMRPSTRPWLAHGLFFLGLFLLLSDMFVPLEWGLLDGDEKLTEPLRLVLLQAGLAAALFALWLAVPSQLVRAIGVPLLLTMLSFQLLALARAVPKSLAFANSQISSGQTLASSSVTRETTNLPNVYHFCFDGYSSLLFRENADSQHLDDEFTGFVFFPRTLANYVWTDHSVPSFLTGRFFTGGSFNDFQLASRSQGLRRELQNAGYQISIYSPDRARPWMYDEASGVTTSLQLAEEHFWGTDVVRLAQIAFVRAAPTFIRRETLNISDKAFEKITTLGQLLTEDPPTRVRTGKYGFYKRLSVPLVEQFLADEPNKASSARYTYAHIMLPHSPYVWKSDCSADVTKSNYRTQASCATLLMKKIVQKLKQLGRYDNSMIIFQSDHGTHHLTEGLAVSEILPFPTEVIKKISGTGVPKKFNRTPEGYFLRLHALLVIKSPRAESQSMRISHRAAQLADVPATIYDLVGIRVSPPNNGTSIFALPEATERELQVFYDYGNRFGHFSYTPAGSWLIRPDIHRSN